MRRERNYESYVEKEFFEIRDNLENIWRISLACNDYHFYKINISVNGKSFFDKIEGSKSKTMPIWDEWKKILHLDRE